MKVELTVPSKMVGYGNVKPVVEVPDDFSPAQLAEFYLTYVMEFQTAEAGIVESKRAPIHTPQPVAEPLTNEASDDGPDDTDEAAETLAEGLGGVTVVEDVEAPWNKAPAEPTVESNAWDTELKFDLDWS